ncbi:MAG: hypothetical protein L0Z53_08120 [Acidobacteriales bacterium]|nr:hypothetical protein [Terriglobales bacterium]
MPRITFALGLGTVLLFSPSARCEPIQLPDGRKLAKVDFERHMHPLLDRLGCNAGKCHGHQNGRGGLSLSLMAAAPGPP